MTSARGFVAPTLFRRVAIAVVALAGVVALGRAAGGEIPRFAAWVAAHGPWAPLAYIGGYALLTVAFVPGALPTMAAGVVFDLVPGTIYAFLGEVLGGATAFWLARGAARPLVEKRLGHSPRFIALDHAVAQQGRRIVMMLRLSPAVPFNLLNYALGITTIRFADYLIASVTMLPGALLFVYYGKLLGDVAALAGGAPVPRDALYWTTTIAGFALTVAVSVALARIATRALRNTGAATDRA